ncbi:hypothetical protein BASA81_000738 [Batrachochytrium salamandrivorans]|nr:hypothetical protein BASA81_000738 [Batrachochytrium salamandrivorans]
MGDDKEIELETVSGTRVFGVLHCQHQGQIIVQLPGDRAFVCLQEQVVQMQPVKYRKTTKWFGNKRQLEEDSGASLCPSLVPLTYWNKRYVLFSKFDSGVELDSESWYSVTPECIALHIAKRLGRQQKLVLDVCCGAGGNAIQFALCGHQVLACEVDPNRVAMAKRNAHVYGVGNKIEFVCADGMQLLASLQTGAVDYCFLSPPWGGPGYQTEDFSLMTNVQLESRQPANGVDLFRESSRVAVLGVVYYLPRQMNLLRLAGELGQVCTEFELHKLAKRDHSICAYFGKGF